MEVEEDEEGTAKDEIPVRSLNEEVWQAIESFLHIHYLQKMGK